MLVKIIYTINALLIVLLFCSCQTAKIKKWTAEELIISDQISLAHPKELSPNQVDNDISFLIYVLKNGYGGRSYVPKDTLSNTIAKLNKISKPSSIEKFRDQIDEALLLLPDNHLKARLDGHPSQQRLSERKRGKVGKNDITNPKKTWETRFDQVGKKKILYISIVNFAPHEDKVWNSFLSSVTSKLKYSDSVVIDMRGNGGGRPPLLVPHTSRDFRLQVAEDPAVKFLVQASCNLSYCVA